MSDVEEHEGTGRKAVLKRHKQEKKDLQNKIQGMKKSTPKGDKKKKKEISDEIEKLEKDLEEKHKAELSQLLEENPPAEPTDDSNPENLTEEAAENHHQIKVTRAQKRRNKKDAETKDREERIQEQAEKNRIGPRHTEMETIKNLLNENSLKIYSIPADGNCLYLAINHQLQVAGKPNFSVNQLRKKTAEHIRTHKEEFLPFMYDEENEEDITDEKFEKYCKNIEKSTYWGGQIELKALSSIVKSPIKVLQATGPATVQGDNFEGPELVLTYHRHLYKLGEHYNSTAPLTEEEQQSD